MCAPVGVSRGGPERHGGSDQEHPSVESIPAGRIGGAADVAASALVPGLAGGRL